MSEGRPSVAQVDAPESWVRRLLPSLEWIGELRNTKTLRADVIAGVTVALVLIPQSMAYAQLAGLPAYYGLYAAFLPPIVAALFGSSRQLQTGPVAIVSIMTAAALEPIATAGSGSFVAYAIMLAVMVGLFELALGLLRLGALVNFLAHPVISGFTNAAAIIIATSQLDKIFGVRAEKGAQYYETISNTVVAITRDTHWLTFAIGALAFAIIIIVRKINPRAPNVLIAVVVTTLLSYAVEFEKLRELRLDQIENPIVREVITDIVAMNKAVDELDERVEKARAGLAEAERSHGAADTRTLIARDHLASLETKLVTTSEEARAGRSELQYLRFRFVPGDSPDKDRYFLMREVPENVQIDGNVWRFSSIEADGRLIVNGGGKVVGAIPAGLPKPKMPTLDFGVIAQLLPAAITIALLGFMEAISIAKAMATRTRQRIDSNQELIGQGLANILGGLFQSYPVSGSFSRSAVNLGAGAVTGFSSVVTGLIVVVALLAFTPLLYHLPQATLAAVIMMAVIGLVNLRVFLTAWRAHPHDGLVAVVTFALTLLMAPHLDYGILIGAGLALGLYLFRTMKPRVAVLGRHPDGGLRDAEMYDLETCKNISMIRFDGSLYFANIGHFEDKLLERVAKKPELKYVIVDAEGINQIDSSGAEALHDLTERLRDAGMDVYLTQVKTQIMDILERTGFADFVGREHFFRTEDQALRHVWDKLGEDHAQHCPLNPHRIVTDDT